MGIKKTATMMDVAREAGVSVATVARVIHDNGYVSQNKRLLIQQAIDKLGYLIPEKEIPAFRKDVVGVWTPPDRENPFFAYLPHALAEEANRNQMYAMLRVGKNTVSNLVDVVNDFTRQGVCGIIVVGFEEADLPERERNLLLDCGVPIVFMERTARCYGLNRVLLDGSEGVYLATRHLLDLGHTHLLYIGSAPNNTVDKQRLKGFKNALSEIGVTNPPIVNTLKDGRICDGYESTKIGLKQWPQTTAIVAWSDQYAIGAMRYCADTNRRIPQDMAITGFDDIFAPSLVPPLTSVGMPLEEMAQAAIQMIIENKHQTMDFYAKTITLSPKLAIRRSTDL